MQHILSNPFDIIVVAIALLSLGIAIYTLIAIQKFNALKTTFFQGKTALDLESVIHTLTDQQKTLHEQQTEAAVHINKLYQQVAGAVQKVGVIRFNPFDDGGGNFSFSIALLDAHNTGVIITSMHGRQQNRIYSKKITEGASETELTQEEAQAITAAQSI